MFQNWGADGREREERQRGAAEAHVRRLRQDRWARFALHTRRLAFLRRLSQNLVAFLRTRGLARAFLRENARAKTRACK